MTDGKNVTGSFASTFINITLTQVVTTGVTVDIWSDAAFAGNPLFVYTNGSGVACTEVTTGTPSLYQYTCENRTVGSIRVQRAISPLVMREVQVFEIDDSTRTYGIFQNI